MSTNAAIFEIDRLIDVLSKGEPSRLGAIPWAQPVLAFGSPVRSRVATLGLNPSNLEFEDDKGAPLAAPDNRFETLQTLKLPNWKNREEEEARRAWLSCEEYFFRRPYHRWFRPLDKVLHRLGASYYCRLSSACHLDLVPFATKQKWSDLTQENRTSLMRLGADSLVRTIRGSEVRVLVLNGASVVKAFQELSGGALRAAEMPAWSLRRGGVPKVRGLAYQGKIESLDGQPLNRDLLVLGYNHNIQSSFGVSSAVVDEISQWVAECAATAIA
jgi:hypothetical protein